MLQSQLKGETRHDNSLTPPYNTGNCSLFNDIIFTKVCKNTITKSLAKQWKDLRAPEGTPYTVWQTSETGKLVLLVSFHKSPLFDCGLLMLKLKGGEFTITAKTLQEAKNFYVYQSDLKHSDIHCLHIDLVYPAALRAHCENRKGDNFEEANTPILHYSRYDYQVNIGDMPIIPEMLVLLSAVVLISV